MSVLWSVNQTYLYQQKKSMNLWIQNTSTKEPNNQLLIDCLKNEDTRQLAENMFNVLEGVTVEMHPVIQQIKDIMITNKALGAMMSGSGPTVFGLYENKEDAYMCKSILENQFEQTFVVACEEKGG